MLWIYVGDNGPNQGSGDRSREGQIDLRNIFKVKSTGIRNLIGLWNKNGTMACEFLA